MPAEKAVKSGGGGENPAMSGTTRTAQAVGSDPKRPGENPGSLAQAPFGKTVSTVGVLNCAYNNTLRTTQNGMTHRERILQFTRIWKENTAVY